MQKWRKVFLVFLFIAAIIGGVVGFAMAKYKMFKIKVLGSFDVFGLFMLGLLVIVFIIMIVDIYNIYKSKKQFGYAEFKLIPSARKRIRNVLIFLIVDTIFIFGTFLIVPDIDMTTFPLCFMMLILTLIHGIHYRAGNGLGENGVLSFGVFHSWLDVKSYKIKNETSLEMNVLIKSCGFKYYNKIKFDLDKKDKYNIEMFLSERL